MNSYWTIQRQDCCYDDDAVVDDCSNYVRVMIHGLVAWMSSTTTTVVAVVVAATLMMVSLVVVDAEN